MELTLPWPHSVNTWQLLKPKAKGLILDKKSSCIHTFT